MFKFYKDGVIPESEIQRVIEEVANELSLVLKEKQLEALSEILSSNRERCVCLPTGYGKSLIEQVW